MPNGRDKNVVRLCAAIDGFRLRFGEWPTIAYLWPGCIEDLRGCLTAEGFANLEAKLQLHESEGATVRVEDASGRSYDYGTEGFPEGEPELRAEEWLQAERRPLLSDEDLKRFNAHLEELRKKHPGQNVWIDLS
jgi:hypothetical protein